MRRLQRVAQDVLECFGYEEVWRELGVLEGESAFAAEALERHLSNLEVPQMIVRFFAGWLGRAGSRRIVRILRLSVPDNVPVEDIVLAWLAFRGVRLPRPQARPISLARVIREKLSQALGHAEAYEAVKTVAPELERLTRLLAFYYLVALESEDARRLAISRSLLTSGASVAEATGRLGAWEMLERLTWNQIVVLLQQLDHCPRAPYDSHCREVMEVLDSTERALVDNLVQARNRVIHGMGSATETTRNFCQNAQALLDRWLERGVVPRGAVVWSARHSYLEEQELVCGDETDSRVLARFAPIAIRPGESLLISPDQSQADINGDRLTSLPTTASWMTPEVGDL